MNASIKTGDLQATIADAIAQLCAETDAAKQSEIYRTWLSAMSRFHEYSFGNCLLILSQRESATRVAGFNTWKSLGRFVKKGEFGIRIFAPIVARKKDQATDEKGALVGYRTVCVFDISQTEGKPLACLETGARDGGDELLPLLEAAAASFGVALSYKHRIGSQGVSKGGSIEVEASLSPSARCGVLAHELAHELLHWKEGVCQKRTKQQEELEAESVAYAVLHHFGMRVGSDFYLASYEVTSEMLASSLPAISATARKIIECVESAAQHGEEDAGDVGDSLLLAA